MSLNGRHDELGRLLEAVCEEQLTPAEAARLQELLLTDREARRFYLDYIHLHGSLYWDAAVGGDTGDSRENGGLAADDSGRLGGVTPASGPGDGRVAPAAPPEAPRRRAWQMAATAATVVCLAIAAMIVFRPRGVDDAPQLAERPAEPAQPDQPPPRVRDPRDANEPQAARLRPGPREPLRLPGHASPAAPGSSEPQVAADSDPVADQPPEPRRRIPPGSVEAVVALINERIRAGWGDLGLEPSPAADDGEWIRRVYLDLVGHIPPPDEVERFLRDRRPTKRAELIDRLLDEPAYVRHWTTVFANLLVGRSMERDVNRPALEKFLRESLAANRPWNEMAAELIAAEGADDENGAATFLIAHLNNEAVPATAITARIFLGVQVGCLQCHDHPVNADWKQERFWELNAFFKHSEVVRQFERDPQTGRRSERRALISRPGGGLTYYETPRGVVKAVLPEYFDRPIDPAPEVHRRGELARLMFEGPQPLAARAMVNRLWAHFFGHGFTRPVDDMGPHNPPTHPELLDELAEQFVHSGYDLKSMMRWIANSEPYQLTSRAHAANAADDPDAGEPPAFSRVYVKPMTAEQLYDSLLVATRADLAAGSSWEAVSRRRQEWLQQFVHAFQTDENDEATHFEGTIPQALAMMNGELVETAVASRRGTWFAHVAAERTSHAEKLRRLCLAALSRSPTDRELRAASELLRTAAAQAARTGRDPQEATLDGLRDVFWAYLNSSEFRLVH